MPRVTFTGNLHRFVDAPPAEVPGRTVREALEAAFAQNPRVRGYVLDDQGGLRRHVIVLVGGEPVGARGSGAARVRAGASGRTTAALPGPCWAVFGPGRGASRGWAAATARRESAP